MTLTGIILCGGASRRMGRPKALLDYEGESFLDRLIGLFQASCDDVIVVLGHEADRILAGSKRASQARCVLNPNYEQGQLSSLQRGLEEAAGADAVLFTPVDYPAVRPSTVQTLAASLRSTAGGFLVAVPRFRGRHGHPAGFLGVLIPEFLALPREATARDVIHRYRQRTLYIDVDDPGVVMDVDDPVQYAALFREASS